jgi:hypothetical protein
MTWLALDNPLGDVLAPQPKKTLALRLIRKDGMEVLR